MGGLLRAEDGEHILNYGTYSYILSVCCNHGSVTTLVDIVLATLLDFTIGACIRTLNHSFGITKWRAIFSSKCKERYTNIMNPLPMLEVPP